MRLHLQNGRMVSWLSDLKGADFWVNIWLYLTELSLRDTLSMTWLFPISPGGWNDHLPPYPVRLRIIAASYTDSDTQIIRVLTTAPVSDVISVIRKPNIRVATGVRTVQNLTVISYVLNSFLLIVTRWTNLLMFVLGVLTKRNVKRTMRITPHTELMQSTQNSFIMPVPVFAPILSV